jgi:hypothetical protein
VLSQWVIANTAKLPSGSRFRFSESIEENIIGGFIGFGLAIALFVNSENLSVSIR